MRLTTKAATIYFALVFAAGFVLGTIRTIALAPYLGPALATILELPLMLLISWLACDWVVNRYAIAPHIKTRVSMGLIAFALLIAAETALGMLGFGRSLADQIAIYRETGPALGLAAQMAFALFPIVQARLSVEPGRLQVPSKRPPASSR